MGYIPVTPFRRLVETAHLEQHRQASAAPPEAVVNKWEVLRELATARDRFGLTDRDLTVLQALIGFHPGATLGGRPIIHAANATICDRLNGMPSSTMRRHLANLVQAGLVWRRDSPNGKRYVRRTAGEAVAYGLDLTPLILRHAEICAAAEEVRALTARMDRLRETLSLMRRDLAGLATYGAMQHPALPLWPQMADIALLAARTLRRRLTLEDLTALHDQLANALAQTRAILEPVAENPGTSDGEIGQHHQNSQKDSHESESCHETRQAEPVAPNPQSAVAGLPLGMILSACPEIQAYADRPIRQWHDLIRAAHIVRPMMGISPDAWANACRHLGPADAAVTLAAILQRFDRIRSPGGYLRSLTMQAMNGVFSTTPMVTALMRQAA